MRGLGGVRAYQLVVPPRKGKGKVKCAACGGAHKHWGKFSMLVRDSTAPEGWRSGERQLVRPLPAGRPAADAERLYICVAQATVRRIAASTSPTFRAQQHRSPDAALHHPLYTRL